jgi:hypothetical protein
LTWSINKRDYLSCKCSIRCFDGGFKQHINRHLSSQLISSLLEASTCGSGRAESSLDQRVERSRASPIELDVQSGLGGSFLKSIENEKTEYVSINGNSVKRSVL